MSKIMKKLCLVLVLVFVSLLSCFSMSTAIANPTLPNRCIIASALGNNLVLDIYGNFSENGTNVQIYTEHGGAAQIFDIVHVENEWYKIVHTSSGKLLDVTGAQVASGVNVQIYEPTGSDAQLWKFIPANGGYYIQNKLGYYLDVCGGTAQNETNVWVWERNSSNAQIWSLKTLSYQPAMWFMDVVKLTQEPGGGYSHTGTLNFDVVGVNNSNIKAPFDCKVVAIYKKWLEGNTVVIESLAPVQYADGTVDYMCMSFAHDNDISNLWLGKTISQGEVFYQTGKYGDVTGVHAHVSCIRGTYQKDIWKRQPPNNNCGSSNSICPTKALFLPEGIAIYETKGLVFKTYNSHTCINFNSVGVCIECGKDFVLQNRTTLNREFTTVKVDGAIHTAPYGDAPISGRLQKNAVYMVTESAINYFGNVWYKLEGTDSNGCEQWVVNDYLEEVALAHNIALPEVNLNITLQATGAGNITMTNATVYGTASYSGSRPSEVGLLFGESMDSLQCVAKDLIDFKKNPFDVWYDLNTEANITLYPGRTYYYQLYAIVDGQYAYSNVQGFTTVSPVSTWTTGVSDITATNATVHGKVQYTGNRPTAVGLLFGNSPETLNNVKWEPINFSKNPFDVWYNFTEELKITLSPGQTYYYQFYVVQDGYYYYSNIDSFQN